MPLPPHPSPHLPEALGWPRGCPQRWRHGLGTPGAHSHFIFSCVSRIFKNTKTHSKIKQETKPAILSEGSPEKRSAVRSSQDSGWMQRGQGLYLSSPLFALRKSLSVKTNSPDLRPTPALAALPIFTRSLLGALHPPGPTGPRVGRRAWKAERNSESPSRGEKLG